VSFLLWGFVAVSRFFAPNPQYKMLLALAGAFVFVLSALKMPSVTGSCSHPTGVGLGAILFGPLPMVVISVIVLFFQALLLAHGGLTTLGANTFSMGVAGPLLAFALYKLAQKLAFPRWLSVFLAATLGNLGTYLVTSLQLALAFPLESGGVAGSFLKFCSIFALTQLPLAVSEGILTIVIFNFLFNYNRQELSSLLKIQKEVHSR
jgi:cobalt/nickel transport system permease protein